MSSLGSLKLLKWWEALILLSMLVIACLASVWFPGDSYARYRLPNGDVVECTSMVETSKGNFYLSGCKNDSEYYVQGTVEKMK